MDLFAIPPKLKWLEEFPDGRGWLSLLPPRVRLCAGRWSLRVEPPYQDSQVSLVFPVTQADQSPAVLKIQFPHAENKYEAEALRRWNGQGSVQLLACEPAHHALLMEKCMPGDALSGVHVDKALEVFIELLPRIWIPADKPFTSLQREATGWAEQLPPSWERAGRPFEVELLDAALAALDALPQTQGEQVLLHQDLHGGNVLRATREPWLVIDPKPLVGEREFALAPIIRACEFGHSRKNVLHRLERLTNALQLDRERTRLWALAQTLAWAFTGDRMIPRHMETARWLWQA